MDARIAIIGGGYYGCRIALALAEIGIDGIVILERESGLMRRASFVNQARVHNGYHYPRSLQTGMSSRANFRRFVEEHAYAVVPDVEMIYAIARDSIVSGHQFARFCDEIGAPWRQASTRQSRLFDSATVAACFAVEEIAFDAQLVAQELAQRLRQAGVRCRFDTRARLARTSDADIELDTNDGSFRAKHVVNCAYAALDDVGIDLAHAIKKELAEVALVRKLPELDGIAATVIDGPFFSSLPFPALDCYSLTHVRYTPHRAWIEPGEQQLSGRTRAELMLRDAARYMPCFARAEHIGSLFELKAILTQSESTDARPILFEVDRRSDRIVSVLGSKFDNIYDVETLLLQRGWDA